MTVLAELPREQTNHQFSFYRGSHTD